MESLPLDRADIVRSAVELVPNRLYWAAVNLGKFSEVLKQEFRTHYIKPVFKNSIPHGASVRSVQSRFFCQKENADLNIPPAKARKSTGRNRVPIVRGCSFKVLYTDKVMCYKPLANDFGPVDLSSLHRYIDFVDENSDSETAIIHVSDHRRPAFCANSAYLVAAYAMLRYESNPAEICCRLSSVSRELIPPFRDASRSTHCTFPLTVLDFCEALQISRNLGWIDWYNFDVAKTERYQMVENGDLNWIIENRFLAFAGPSSDRIDEDGLDTLPPSHYVGLFRDLGVTDVVRLNVSNYDPLEFTSEGINHHDLFFEDGSCPPMKIVKDFLSRVERAKGAVAVHCKAGLGRSATLIGLAVMKQFGVSARHYIAWARVARPGCVIGPQQQFLVEMEPLMHGKIPHYNSCIISGEKGQGERLLKQKRKNRLNSCN